jgi:hypothetical protein
MCDEHIIGSYNKCYYVNVALVLFKRMKIVYHCVPCNKDFTDIDLARDHSKSLCHDFFEKIIAHSKEAKSLLLWNNFL